MVINVVRRMISVTSTSGAHDPLSDGQRLYSGTTRVGIVEESASKANNSVIWKRRCSLFPATMFKGYWFCWSSTSIDLNHRSCLQNTPCFSSTQAFFFVTDLFSSMIREFFVFLVYLTYFANIQWCAKVLAPEVSVTPPQENSAQGIQVYFQVE